MGHGNSPQKFAKINQNQTFNAEGMTNLNISELYK